MRRVISTMLTIALFAAFMSLSTPASANTTWIDEGFESPTWDDDGTWWNWLAGDYLANTQIPGVSGNGTRITMTPGRHDAAQLNYQFTRHGHSEPDEAWFRYWMRFDAMPEDSGKLPGFMALYSDSARANVPPTESQPGWSARVQFAPGDGGTNVKLGYYLYWLGQAGSIGDGLVWSEQAPLGEWVCVEGRAAMNTPGSHDGELDAWLNGNAVFHKDDILYRSASQTSVHIRDFMFVVHYGGSETPPRDIPVSFDELVVADHRVGCGSPAPTSSFEDTVGSSFVADIEWLSAQGITKGCNPTANTRFCPNQSVTRGQMAAFLHRALGGVLDVPAPPAPPPDPPKMWGVEVYDYKAALSTMASTGNPIDLLHLDYALSEKDWLAVGHSAPSSWAPLQMSAITDAGGIPFIEFYDVDIAGFNAGHYDREFRGWLDTITGWLASDSSHQALIVPFPEANNGNTVYGDSTTAYKTAYRKVADAVRSRGIGSDRARFVHQMSANLASSRYSIAEIGNGFGAYSPGPGYVDLAAISWLNDGRPTWDGWTNLYKARVDEMNRTLGPDVPILLSFIASSPSDASGNDRASWMSDLAGGIVGSSTAVGFVYLDKDRGYGFEVGTETSPAPEFLDLVNRLDSTGAGIDWIFDGMDNWKQRVRESSATGAFSDDNGSVFESDIAWLARSGITRGCGDGIFCPDEYVTRGQMAAFLHRALGAIVTPKGSSGSFVDTDDSSFEADIAWLAATGITKGCNPPANDRFCPDASVTRGQMAAFLHRALGGLLG